ncbi:nucleoside monophosphate kinase [Phycicoccus sp. Soil802]|uniref:adenylate kinase family protein n=1 Tax=Phycicoccus sp. Soil802 TaxID=1736414 RepID=UPI0012FB963F
MRAIVLGPPGAGVMTQTRLLAGALGLSAVSVDDFLRLHISRGTPLGDLAKRSMGHGGPVSENILHAVARDGLARTDTSLGWVLAGYPRTAQQLSLLLNWTRDCGQTIDVALVLGVGEREVLRRLLPGTRPCESEHLEAWVRNSYQRFSDSLPLLMATLKDHGLLQVVDGHGHVHQVATRCLTLARQVVRARALG